MKKSRLIRVSHDMYNYLKTNAIKNDSNLRVESKKMFTQYKEYKVQNKKLEGKRLFVLGK